MGFRKKLADWIWFSILTSWFLVLVSGTLSGFFESSRCLRQGDPLSPYFYVLVMHALTILFQKVGKGCFICSFKVEGRKEEGVEISHLLFVDYTFFFGSLA